MFLSDESLLKFITSLKEYPKQKEAGTTTKKNKKVATLLRYKEKSKPVNIKMKSTTARQPASIVEY